MRSLLRYSFLLMAVLGFSLLSTLARAELKEHTYYRVSRVIDGDTIKLQNGEMVRLIGIDTPEMKNNAKLKRDVKERHVTAKAELKKGRQAYLFTKHLVEGKKVHLKFDRNKYDNYHRTLAYVFLSSGLFVNAEIVKDGYAYVYSVKPDLQYAPLFRRLYKEAKDHRRGLWGSHPGRASNPAQGVKWFKSGTSN